MTDDSTPEQPQTLKVFTCWNPRHPTRSCFALIEDTRDTRQKHRQWHLDQETDREALRGGIKSRDETIALLRQEIAGYGRDVEAYGREVSAFHGEVQRVETPTAPPALEINRDGYSEDETEDEPSEPDEDWAVFRTAEAAAADDDTEVDDPAEDEDRAPGWAADAMPATITPGDVAAVAGIPGSWARS